MTGADDESEGLDGWRATHWIMVHRVYQSYTLKYRQMVLDLAMHPSGMHLCIYERRGM